MMQDLQIPRWIEVMAYLNEHEGESISDINRNIRMTYSHTTAVVKELSVRKYVNKRKKGRISMVTLTAKGRKLAEVCQFIYKTIEGV